MAPGLVCRRPRLSDENQTASLHSCSVLRGSLSQDLGAYHAWGPGGLRLEGTNLDPESSGSSRTGSKPRGERGPHESLGYPGEFSCNAVKKKARCVRVQMYYGPVKSHIHFVYNFPQSSRSQDI